MFHIHAVSYFIRTRSCIQTRHITPVYFPRLRATQISDVRLHKIIYINKYYRQTEISPRCSSEVFDVCDSHQIWVNLVSRGSWFAVVRPLKLLSVLADFIFLFSLSLRPSAALWSCRSSLAACEFWMWISSTSSARAYVRAAAWREGGLEELLKSLNVCLTHHPHSPSLMNPHGAASRHTWLNFKNVWVTSENIRQNKVS